MSEAQKMGTSNIKYSTLDNTKDNEQTMEEETDKCMFKQLQNKHEFRNSFKASIGNISN